MVRDLIAYPFFLVIVALFDLFILKLFPCAKTIRKGKAERSRRPFLVKINTGTFIDGHIFFPKGIQDIGHVETETSLIVPYFFRKGQVSPKLAGLPGVGAHIG